MAEREPEETRPNPFHDFLGDFPDDKVLDLSNLPSDIKVRKKEHFLNSDGDLMQPYLIYAEQTKPIQVLVMPDHGASGAVRLQWTADLSEATLEYLDELLCLSIPMALYPNADPLELRRQSHDHWGDKSPEQIRRQQATVNLITDTGDKYVFRPNIASVQRKYLATIKGTDIDQVRSFRMSTALDEENRIGLGLFRTDENRLPELVLQLPLSVGDKVSPALVERIFESHVSENGHTEQAAADTASVISSILEYEKGI